MPFKSEKQRRFMEMMANNPAKANKDTISQETAQKFEAEADKMPIEKAKDTVKPIQPVKPNKFGKLKAKLGLK